MTALSIFGLLAASRLAGCLLVICGAGATFIVALALAGMRAADQQRAASLSTMSQASAYLNSTCRKLGISSQRRARDRANGARRQGRSAALCHAKLAAPTNESIYAHGKP